MPVARAIGEHELKIAAGLKALFTAGRAFGAIIVAAVECGVLQHTVVANADRIDTIEKRVDRVENRAGDVRER